jgi:hypothetical protein
MTRRRDYPIIRFLIGSFYGLAFLILLGSLFSAGYLWILADAHRGDVVQIALSSRTYDSSELCFGAAVIAGGGLVLFLLLGAAGQMLAMQRDRAINASLQVQLLEDILEQNEEAVASQGSRVELCEGCGRLGSLHRIESGQWVCRDCRRQLRSA